MSSQYGELRPSNGWVPFGSLGHLSKLQRVSRLGRVTVQRHLYSTGRPSRWALAHIIVLLFSSRILSRRRLDVYHTCTQCVVLVQIYDAGLKHAARGSLEIQNLKIANNLPSGHHRTTLSGYVFATKACVDNRKKLLNSTISPTRFSQYGELWRSNRWDRFGCLRAPQQI